MLIQCNENKNIKKFERKWKVKNVHEEKGKIHIII